jgi:hypothetical protein
MNTIDALILGIIQGITEWLPISSEGIVSLYLTSKGIPLHQLEMIFDCGNNIDRDRNTAIDVMLRYLSQNANWTGYREFLDNLQAGLQLVVTCKNLHV